MKARNPMVIHYVYDVDMAKAFYTESFNVKPLIELREPKGGVPVRVAIFKDCEGNGFELRQQP